MKLLLVLTIPLLVVLAGPKNTVTLRRRAPRNNQSPSEEEDPGAASHPRRKGPSHFLRPRSSQPPLEEEDPGAPRHYWDKRPPLPPIQGRNVKTSVQKYIHNMKNKTSPESSPPPRPRPEHCNVVKTEENDLKNSLMKMIEEALEGKMKNAVKANEEKTSKKLEEMNKEIEEKNKKQKK
ncbi:hypothetical protein STEG23_009743 [Scotinomys teguina]